MILNDSFSKTVTIPIRFKDGKLINHLTNEELAGIADGAMCDLTLSAFNIEDKDLLSLLNDEGSVEMLPQFAKVLLQINPDFVPRGLTNLTVAGTKVGIADGGSFVEVVLAEPLKMQCRGTKQPALMNCKCVIPALGTKAESLNHAYTLVSTAFEPVRRSHTGNVFKKVFYPCHNEKWNRTDWWNLDRLRLTKLQSYWDHLCSRYEGLKKKRLEQEG